MDDRSFDTWTRRWATSNRRGLLKAMLGLGAGAVGGALVVDQTSAARRGFSGPRLPIGLPGGSECGPSNPCPADYTCISGRCVLE